MALRGQIVSLSGVDGCGKTAIINELRVMLAARGQRSRYVWLRYNHYTSKILLGFCRLAGLTRYEKKGGVRVGYHDFEKSRIVSWLFVATTYLDTLLASLVKVYVPSLFGSTVIYCDRWIVDIMVDLEIDTGLRFERDTWPGRLFWRLVPARCRCLVIDRDEGKLKAARPENAIDADFDQRIALYRRHAADPRITALRNDGSVAEAAERICMFAGFG